MAAALLAALFAMGVFSGTPLSVSAHECVDADDTNNDDTFDSTDSTHTDVETDGNPCFQSDHGAMHRGIVNKVSTSLSNSLPETTGVTLEVEFSVTVGSDVGGDIVIAVGNFDLGTAPTLTVVTATQGGESLTITQTSPITISTYDADHPIMVKFTNMVNPSATEDDTITVTQAAIATLAGTSDAGISVSGGQLKLSSKTAGDAVQVVLQANAESSKGSETDITIDLKKFGVPTTIAERSVIINDTNGYIGEPAAVVVNGTKVTLSLYARFPGQSEGTAGNLEGPYSITFKQSAGITNPILAGTATVEVNDGDTNNHALKSPIESKVSLSAASGARGTGITVSGVGLGKGGATVYLVAGTCPDQGKDAAGDDCTEENDISLANSPTSGAKVSADVETSSSDFERGAVQVDKSGNLIGGDRGPGSYRATDVLRGMNQITIVDGTGRTADKPAWFMITPTISVDEDSVQQGDELAIIVEDWFDDGDGTSDFSVTIGDEGATIEDTDFDDGDGEIEILVPTSARLGEQELKVVSETSTDLEGSLSQNKKDVAKGSVIIGALDMTVEPSTFVLGQQFTIKVNGFSTDDPPADDEDTDDINESDAIQLVKVGDLTLDETTGGESIDDLTIDTNGDFTNTFVVKSTFKDADDNEAAKELTPGTYRVQIEDHSGRIAIGKITIPDPSITIDPAVSRRGTTVTLAGENFPAGRVVEVFYKEAMDELLQGAVLADSAGKIRVNFSVPSDAEIGEEQDVIALSAANKSKFKAKAVHALPDQEIIVTPTQVSAGGRLKIEGHNMPLFTLVGLRIADISVAGKGAETDGLGSFVKDEVLVPQLKPGTHTVEATVQTQGGEAKVRTTIEIVDVITRDSEEAFEDLITNGTLTRVWHLDAATQTWSFFDPAPEFADFNTLTQVSSDQIVTVIMNAQDEFQGKTLYVGSNNVAIE